MKKYGKYPSAAPQQHSIQICKSIISYKSFKNSSDANLINECSVFLDMAEVWENYIYKLLVRNLDGYDIINLNLTGGDFLFEGNKRPIRFDILIKREGKMVAIIDAKYKWYKKIGNNEQDSNAISIADLYQMTIYLHRYWSEDTIGLFATPCTSKDNGLDNVKGNNNQIGVLGLDLDFNANEKQENKELYYKLINREKEFIEKIKTYVLKL